MRTVILLMAFALSFSLYAQDTNLKQLKGEVPMLIKYTDGTTDKMTKGALAGALAGAGKVDCDRPDQLSLWTSAPGIIHTGIPCPTNTKVGINVSDPTVNLHVRGDGWFSQNLKIGVDGSSTTYKLEIGTNNFGPTTNGILIDHGASSLKNALSIRDNGENRFNVFSNGVISARISDNAWVAMEIKNPDGEDIFKINHDGAVVCTKVAVRMVPFPDYVFDQDYKLLPLAELENFVSTNKHLPNVPTAAEVEQNGADLGEINRVLVEKVEEQTLYLIQHEKKISELENTLQQLLKKMEAEEAQK